MLATALAAIVSLAVISAPAFAALSHPISHSFPLGECSNPENVAVVESTELVYVGCRAGSEGPLWIERFDTDGNPVDFTASGDYIEDNKIILNPNPAYPAHNGGAWGAHIELTVDNSSANNGFLYVGNNFSSSQIEVFDPTGKWLAALPLVRRPSAGLGGASSNGVGVDRQGYIYVGSTGAFSGVTKWTPGFRIAEVFSSASGQGGGRGIRPDSTGAVWNWSFFHFGTAPVYKFEADQFVPFDHTPASSQLDDLRPAVTSPFAPDPVLPSSDFYGLDVDPNNDNLYVSRRTCCPISKRIERYSPGTVDDPMHQVASPLSVPFDPPSLSPSGGRAGVAITSEGHLYTTSNDGGTGEVMVFAPGEPLPEVTTNPAEIDDIDHTAAVVTGHVALAGGADITDCEVEYGTTTAYGSTAPCSPDPASSPPGSNFAADTHVSAELSGLTTNTAYHYRFTSSNPDGEGWGADRTVTPAAVIKLKTLAATSIDEHNATLNGSFDPDGLQTTYHFEYGVDTDYGQSTPEVDVGSASGVTPVSETIGDLQRGRTYHYRIVAENSLGVTHGPDMTVRTATSPEIIGTRAADLSTTGATLNARINPEGYATTYRFEYGTSANYGSSAPVPDGTLGPETTAQPVSVELTDLQPGVTYHFRVVATNQWGTSTSDNNTFSFSPPACPNAHVRQLTGSAYLPDCRAYELVSPGKAGAVRLFPSDEIVAIRTRAFATSLSLLQWPQNTGLATSPSRFMFYGGLGSISGLDAPNTLIDAYLATRTNQGWVTTLPGLTGAEANRVGRRVCSTALDRCLDHISGLLAVKNVNAPYLFDVTGKKLGHLPNNVKVIPGGENFQGDQRPSADFTHFAFSSRDVAFAPGGLVAAPGSAYDNDLVDKSVTIISKLPNGDDIPRDGGPADEYIHIPEISTDGSHILMRTRASGGPHHLYMRVDGAVTYDIARGFGAKLVGMTSDGSKVLFTTANGVTPDDTDASVDLYMWSEQGDTVTRISQGNGQGDSDSCAADWTSQCDVAPLETERGPLEYVGPPTTNPPRESRIPGLDDMLASGSGDVYFYSPENLDGSRAGIPGKRNLYLHRDGQVQLVASLDPGTEVNRMQISPDGRKAAFLTASRLTGYDNDGRRQMYTYDADTGAIRCASCHPGGEPPGTDVVTSQGGPFMSNDGRAFFATRDALVPQDTDRLTDVYEFVGGRPQLISSGTGPRDAPLGGSTTLIHPPVRTGLEAVSADGVDVYFSTYDSLVPQDQNGEFVKFYNARTNGGFLPAHSLAPCAAADECHGEDSSPPAAPQIGSDAAIGNGNVRAARVARRCQAIGRKVKRLSRRAEEMRRQARRRAGGQGKRLRHRALRTARRAMRNSKSAKRCRSNARRLRAGSSR